MTRFVFAAVLSVLSLAPGSVAHADGPSPLQLAKALTQAIEKEDNDAIATLLVGAVVPKNYKKGTQKLATKEAAIEWLERGSGLVTKGGEKCRGACCTYSENDGEWGDIASHPHKICTAKGKIVSLQLVHATSGR